MCGAERLAKQRRINIALQYLQLKKACPEGHGQFVQGHSMIWRYETKPTPLSRTYTIRIEYRLDKAPKIFVVSPQLRVLSEGRDVPHLYSQAHQELCLYRPGKGEWSPTLLIAETILPWVALWLYYFEDWLVTDEWKGGGEHP